MSTGGSTLPRRRLGRYVGEARSALGMTQQKVGALADVSTTTLQRLERGEPTRVKVRDLEALCAVLEISPKQTAAMVGLLQQAAVKSWYHAFDDVISEGFNVYVGLESEVDTLTCYRSDMLPGLFQTPDYARILDRTFFPDSTPEELERRIQLRLKRQMLITRKTQPATVEVVLHEAVLRYMVGGPKIMSAQLRHLANMPPNVTVRIQPFTAGFPLGTAPGPFMILDFGLDTKGREVEPTLVYVESYAGDMYHERPQDVQRYRQAYQTLRRATLDTTKSKSLLRRIAKEYGA